jgi:hypothetical protein
LAGLSLQSELELPELEEIPGGCNEADVLIHRGSVPEQLTDASRPDRWVQISGDRVLVRIPGIGRYLVRAGREVLVDPEPGAEDCDVRVFLLGSAFGALYFQLGFFPLHASVVVIEGRAVAFAADSGGGKSTMAAWMHRRGYAVLCDDVCVVRFDADGRPIAYPGIRRLKLWQDALTHFQFAHDRLQRDYLRKDKFQVPLLDGFSSESVRLSDLFFLEYISDEAAPSVEPIHPARGLPLVRDHTYRYQYISGLDLAESHFEDCARILRSVRLYRLLRPRRLSRLPDCEARILDTVR